MAELEARYPCPVCLGVSMVKTPVRSKPGALAVAPIPDALLIAVTGDRSLPPRICSQARRHSSFVIRQLLHGDSVVAGHSDVMYLE